MNLLVRENSMLFKVNKFYSFLDTTTNHKFCYFLFIILIYTILYYLNLKTPFIGDDYVYSFIFTTTTRISSASDILTSQIIHYNVWGGRSVVHFILQLLLLIKDSTIVSAINSFIFLLFILVVQFHILGKVKCNINTTFVVFCLTLLIQPAFGETCLWLTGSVNYLWGTTIILYFLLPYRIYFSSENNFKPFFLFSILMFICGIITGWTNENTVAGIIIIILSFILYYKNQKKIIAKWVYWGLLGIIVGYAIMIVAPGNFARASEAGSPSLVVISFRLFTYTESFINYLSLINLALTISFILCFKFSSKKRRQQSLIAVIYMLGVFSSIYSMILSPSFPPRAWFGVITLNIIAFGIIFYNLNFNLQFLRVIRICFSFYCMLNVLFVLYEGSKDVVEIKQIWNKRLTDISYSNNNTKVFTFPKYEAKTKFGMSDAPYANKYISNYYHIKFDLVD